MSSLSFFSLQSVTEAIEKEIKFLSEYFSTIIQGRILCHALGYFYIYELSLRF